MGCSDTRNPCLDALVSRVAAFHQAFGFADQRRTRRAAAWRAADYRFTVSLSTPNGSAGSRTSVAPLMDSSIIAHHSRSVGFHRRQLRAYRSVTIQPLAGRR